MDTQPSPMFIAPRPALKRTSLNLGDTTSFHLFPWLPTELRFMIWEAAIRDPNLPCAHYFTLFSYRDRHSYGDFMYRLGAPTPLDLPSELHGPYFVAGAPKFAENGTGYSWTTDNPSAYTTDYGLWQACMESSRIMRKHIAALRKKSQGKPSPRFPFWEWDDLREARAAGPQLEIARFEEHGREGWLAISPKQDLLILQPFDVYKLGHIHMWGNGLDSIPFTSPEFGGAANIGFELGSERVNGVPQGYNASSRVEMMWAAVQMIVISPHCNYKVWIIDNDLEMEREVLEEVHRKGPPRLVFQGRDRTFVEAYEGDVPGGRHGPAGAGFLEQEKFQDRFFECLGHLGSAPSEFGTALVATSFSIRVAGWVRDR